MAEDKNKEASESKGAIDQFVRTLGLMDIIIGALILYWIFLWFGTGLSTYFKSTGSQTINIALLICAAAIVGKMLTSVAYLMIALVEAVIELLDIKQYYSTLQEAITKFEQFRATALKVTLPDTTNWNRVDLAFAYVTELNPGLRLALENLRLETVLAYSAVILFCPYSIYFYSVGVPWLLILLLILAGVALLLLGFVKQLDFLATLRNSIVARTLSPLQTVETRP